MFVIIPSHFPQYVLQELEKQLLDIEPAKLPDVPSTEPPAAAKAKPQKVTEEEDPDMAELAAWAS